MTIFQCHSKDILLLYAQLRGSDRYIYFQRIMKSYTYSCMKKLLLMNIDINYSYLNMTNQNKDI